MLKLKLSVLSATLALAYVLPITAYACDICEDDEDKPVKEQAAEATKPTLQIAQAQPIQASAQPQVQAQVAMVNPQSVVVVTGKKNVDASTLTQPDVKTARERIERTAGGAHVVDAKEYREGRVSTLADALNYSPGVLVQPRFGAEETRLSIRGSGAQRTFHGRGLKLMQDGVPLNLADGSFDFQAVDALSARYVEVWRGANALQYGAANLGGAINFVSPNGLNSDVFDLRLEAGSFDYQRLHISTGNVSDKFDYYLAANQFKQRGFRDHAVQDTGRVFANLGYSISPQLETRFYIGKVESDSELPGSLTKAQLQANAQQAAAGNITGNQKRDIDWQRLSNKTVYALNNQRFEFFIYNNRKQLFHPIFQVIDQKNNDSGLELRYVLDSELAGMKHRFVAGVNAARGDTDEDRWLNVRGNRGARTNQSQQHSRNTEVYAESQLDVMPALTLSLGVQHAKASRKLDDTFIAGTAQDPVSENFDLSYSGTSPKLGALYRLSPNVQLFANVSKSFEPPSFGELAGGLRPVLNRAQSATTFEVGTRGTVGTINWDAALYRANVKDELLQVGTNVVNAPITINAPKTLHQGLELAASGQYANGVLWKIGANFNAFSLRDDPNFGSNPLPGLPKRVINAEVGYRFNNSLKASVNAQTASGYPIDFANSFYADSYTIWGVKFSQALNKQLSWFLEGRNLGNKAYASTTGIVRNAAGRDQAQFMPGDGRAVYAGMEFKFN
jgi:iron complex outermembrane recepter protein